MSSPIKRKLPKKKSIVAKSTNVAETKPKKLTKKQKEELKNIEEANRKKAELEEKEKAEKDAILEEERFHMQKQEAERHLLEYNQLTDILSIPRKKLISKRCDDWENWKWNNYVNCRQIPDCTELKQINTFISLAKDNINLDSEVSTFLKTLNETQLILSELEERLREASVDKNDANLITNLNEAFENLQKFFHSTMTLFSFKCLSTAKQFCLSRTGNYQNSFTMCSVEMYFWANFALSQRIKHNSFGNIGIDFSTSICLNPVSIRVVHYKVDRQSIQSDRYFNFWKEIYCVDSMETFQPYGLPPVIPAPRVKFNPVEIIESDAPKTRKKKKKQDTSKDSNIKQEAKSLKNYLDKTAKRTKNKKSLLRTSLLNKVTTIWQGETAAAVDKQIAFDPIEINQAEMAIIDGVYEVQIFRTPPQPQIVDSWIVQDVTDQPNLITYHYPPTEISHSEGPEYLSVVAKMPKEDVFLTDEPVPAMWDPTTKIWKKSVYFTHAEYDKEHGVLKFRMSKPGTLAFFQRNNSQFPFRWWQLMSTGKNKAKFVLRTEALKMHFEIQVMKKNDKIILAIPEKYEWPKLRPLSQRYMTLYEMSKALLDIGVHIFPSDKMTNLKKAHEAKHFEVEVSIYKSMASCVGYVAFQQSRWNSELARGQIAFRACAVKEAEILQDDLWPVYLATGDKVEKLKVLDNAPKFDETLCEHCVARQNFPRLLLDENRSIENLREIFEKNNVEFTYTICDKYSSCNKAIEFEKFKAEHIDINLSNLKLCDVA